MFFPNCTNTIRLEFLKPIPSPNSFKAINWIQLLFNRIIVHSNSHLVSCMVFIVSIVSLPQFCRYFKCPICKTFLSRINPVPCQIFPIEKSNLPEKTPKLSKIEETVGEKDHTSEHGRGQPKLKNNKRSPNDGSNKDQQIGCEPATVAQPQERPAETGNSRYRSSRA